jgi:uncharacterized CHY-type Zn-finger protein
VCLLCETAFHKCFGNSDLDPQHIKNYFCIECTENIEKWIVGKLNIQRVDKHAIIVKVLKDQYQEGESVTVSHCLLCDGDIGSCTSATDAGDYVCKKCQEEFLEYVKNNTDIGKQEKYVLIAGSMQKQCEDKKSGEDKIEWIRLLIKSAKSISNMAYNSESDNYECSVFERILYRFIHCEGPTGREEDEFLYHLAVCAREFVRTHPIARCINEIQRRFAEETYECIVEGRQDGNTFFGRTGDVYLDELKSAIEMATAKKREVNVDLSSALECIKM